MTNTEKPNGDDQFQSLLDTVERLRSEKFNRIDPGLVREILRLHSSGAAADGELVRWVEQAVERDLEKGI